MEGCLGYFDILCFCRILFAANSFYRLLTYSFLLLPYHIYHMFNRLEVK